MAVQALQVVPWASRTIGGHGSRGRRAPVRRIGADIFLVAEDRLTLIDAGMVGSRRTLERQLRGMGRSLDELQRIICTHGHPDHIGGVHELVRDRDNVEVLIHPADLAGLQLPLREALGRARDGGGRRGRLIQYLTRTPANCTPIEDGTLLPLLGGLRVVHTPATRPEASALCRTASSALHRRRAAGHQGAPDIRQLVLQPRPRRRGHRSSGSPRWTSTRSPSPTIHPGPMTPPARSASSPRPRRADRSSSAVAHAEDAHMDTINALLERSVERFGPHPALIISPGSNARLALLGPRAPGAEDRSRADRCRRNAG